MMSKSNIMGLKPSSTSRWEVCVGGRPVLLSGKYETAREIYQKSIACGQSVSLVERREDGSKRTVLSKSAWMPT